MYDVWLPRIGMLALGLAAVFSAVAGAMICYTGRDFPCGLENIGIGAISALGTATMALTRRMYGRRDVPQGGS